eukprot:608126-Prorocentrum_minimum.AAC.2
MLPLTVRLTVLTVHSQSVTTGRVHIQSLTVYGQPTVSSPTSAQPSSEGMARIMSGRLSCGLVTDGLASPVNSTQGAAPTAGAHGPLKRWRSGSLSVGGAGSSLPEPEASDRPRSWDGR